MAVRGARGVVWHDLSGRNEFVHLPEGQGETFQLAWQKDGKPAFPGRAYGAGDELILTGWVPSGASGT